MRRGRALRRRYGRGAGSGPLAPRFRFTFADGGSVVGPVQGSGGFVKHLKGAFGMLSIVRLAQAGRDTHAYEPSPGHVVVFPKWTVHDDGPREAIDLRKVVAIHSLDTPEGTVNLSDYADYAEYL